MKAKRRKHEEVEKLKIEEQAKKQQVRNIPAVTGPLLRSAKYELRISSFSDGYTAFGFHTNSIRAESMSPMPYKSVYLVKKYKTIFFIQTNSAMHFNGSLTKLKPTYCPDISRALTFD